MTDAAYLGRAMPSTARLRADASGEAPQALTVAAEPRPGAGRATVLGDAWLVAITAAVTLPILWLGYGTDLDIGFVLDAGARIRDFDYVPSRNPGVPVVEAIVAVLDPVGGHVLVNLATAAALAATVVAVARLVTAWGHDNGDLVALAFLASPIVVISGTQTADFVWAVAFLSWGALLLVRRPPGRGGRAAGAVVGSRSSTLLLVAALLVAVGWDRDERRRVATAAAVAAPLPCCCTYPCGCRTTASSISSTPPTAGST